MKLLFGCFTASFFLILCTNANSQNKFTDIKGQVLISDNILPNTITITLNRLPDSAVIATTYLPTDGFYTFANVAPGSYFSTVKHAGYQTYISTLMQIGSNTTFQLPPISLRQIVRALKEVTITNKTAYIENRPDKVILNVEKGVLANGVSSLDILGTAPGVRVSSSGDIFLKAGQKAAIAINGRMVKLSGQDLTDQLQNLSSGSISQVELITNPSARYDAAGAGGVINIILKKGQNEGFNGSITPGVGYGNFFRTSVNTNLNYRSGPVNFFGNFNFNGYNTNHTIITNRYVGSSSRFDVNYYNKQKTYSGSYNFGADYAVDATHTVGFLVVGSASNNFLNKNTVSAITGVSAADSSLITLSTLNKRISNINYNLNYNGKIGHTNQTLSADADYNIYNRNSYEDLNSKLYQVPTSATRYFRNEAPTHITDLSGRIDYLNPVNKKHRLEAGLKTIFAKSTNSQQFDNIINGGRFADAVLSSRFNYAENITSGYFNYVATPSAKFDWQFDLRVEHTESDANTLSGNNRVKRSYTDYFPVLMLNYKPDTDNRFSLNFNRRIDRPTYQELNPIIAYQDKYNFTSGNAYLRPAYQYMAEVSHTYKNKFTTTLYATATNDFYGFTYFSQNDVTGTFIVGKTNLQHTYTYGITLDAAVDICRWWNVNFNMDASYQRYRDYAGLLNQHSTDAIFKLNQQLSLPGGVAVNVFAQYEVPTFYAIYYYRASYAVSPGATKKLFGKKGTLSLNVKDIFNTDRNRYSSQYANLDMVGYDKKETRIYTLSFSYRFGKSTVKASRRHATGNNEDIKRVTGVN